MSDFEEDNSEDLESLGSRERLYLRKILELTEDNHRLLRKLNRARAWDSFWGWLKVILFLVPFAAGYFYLHPYLNQITEVYQSISKIGSVPSQSVNQLQSIWQNFFGH